MAARCHGAAVGDRHARYLRKIDVADANTVANAYRSPTKVTFWRQLRIDIMRQSSSRMM